MNKWHWDPSHEDDPVVSPYAPIDDKQRGKMPVASEARAKAASKETWRSRRATKRVARLGGGIRNRRNKKVE